MMKIVNILNNFKKTKYLLNQFFHKSNRACHDIIPSSYIPTLSTTLNNPFSIYMLPTILRRRYGGAEKISGAVAAAASDFAPTFTKAIRSLKAYEQTPPASPLRVPHASDSVSGVPISFKHESAPRRPRPRPRRSADHRNDLRVPEIASESGVSGKP